MTRLAGNMIGPRTVVVALALCGVQFVDVLGVTVVVTALPRMLSDLGGSTAQGTVVVTAYAMLFGGLLMVASRLGDRVGHRRAVLAALGLFAVASALGAVAGSVWLLATARGLQGVAAAASVPSALRLLTTVVPGGHARRRAVAGWSAAGAAAGASGFVLGGVLTELASWRAVFWVTIGLAAVLAVAIATAVPGDRASGSSGRVGWPSALLLTGGAMGVVAGTTLLGEHDSVLLGAAIGTTGVIAAAAFWLVERRADRPLVPQAARRSPGLWWGAFGSFVNTATTSSSVTVVTLYVQGELGLTPSQAAALLVSFSVLVVLGVVAAGNALLVVWPGAVGIGMAAGVCGLGIGIGSVAATAMGMAVDEVIAGVAAGVLNTAAQLGTAIGTALVLLAATAFQPRIGWALAAVGAGLAAAATARCAPAS
jgi:MFS family permease